MGDMVWRSDKPFELNDPNEHWSVSGIGPDLEALNESEAELLRDRVIEAWLDGGWVAAHKAALWRVHNDLIRKWLRGAGYDPVERPVPLTVIRKQAERATTNALKRVAEQIELEVQVQDASKMVDATHTLKNLTQAVRHLRAEQRVTISMPAPPPIEVGPPRNAIDAHSREEGGWRARLELGREVAERLEGEEDNED